MGTYKDYVNSPYNYFGSTSEILSREVLMAYTYGIQLDSGIYLPNNSDLKDSKSKKRYNKIIKKIVKANPNEYFVSEFKSMEPGEILEHVLYILFSIFGDSKKIEKDDFER